VTWFLGSYRPRKLVLIFCFADQLKFCFGSSADPQIHQVPRFASLAGVAAKQPSSVPARS